MAELTYEDFKRRVNIQDVLVDAGYTLNRRDGLRYPSYVRLDSDGKRVRGDKYIVTANGMCCFQPPERKNYNVISFIKEHPQLFSEYSPGISGDRLVNLVCCRLLNEPVSERRNTQVFQPKDARTFNISDYEFKSFSADDWESQKPFFSYFAPRGITRDTQKAFAGHFFLATAKNHGEKVYQNLSFPLSIPGQAKVVGLEERSRPNKDGRTAYKGMAKGSNATEGLWIANLKAVPFDKVKDVYWFESAFDAMAFYQIKTEQQKSGEAGSGAADELARLSKSLFVSTGGNPSMQQFKGMLGETGKATHHLCFDRDLAGCVFAINFALTRANRDFKTYTNQKGQLVVIDSTDDKFQKYELSLKPFDYARLAKVLGVSRIQSNELDAYMQSLREPGRILSGDSDLLPERLSKYFASYEHNWIEWQSAKQSGLVCREELEDMKADTQSAFDMYKEMMTDAADEYRKEKTREKTLYEPCDTGYKDWNDQLMGKRQYTDEDIVETAIDGAEGEFRVDKEDFEESRKRDDEEDEDQQEERKHHHRR